jgi:hydroxymethylbilane synthase
MAIAQSMAVKSAVESVSDDIEVQIVRLSVIGDRDRVSRLGKHGGKSGAFVGEIRNALLSAEIDLAMHSLKDMPGNEEDHRFVIGAYLPRDDPRDALVVRRNMSIDQLLTEGGKIGTQSIRRTLLAQKIFPVAEFIHFRGGATTRIDKLDNGSPQELDDGSFVGPADALIMSYSGLERVDLESRATKIFSTSEMLPAVGQGTIAVECAAKAWKIREVLDQVNDTKTENCVLAEREMLWVLDGHCNSPIAGLCTIDGNTNGLKLTGQVISPENGTIIDAECSGSISEPRALGRDVAQMLNEQGAAQIIQQSKDN